MPVHDWTRVDAGIFHDFHNAWLTEIRNVLNNGALPEGYYVRLHRAARGSDHSRRVGAVPRPHSTSRRGVSPSWTSVGRCAAAGPMEADSLGVRPTRRRTLAVRHVSGHRLVALIEVVSPSNKDRADHVEEFVAKVTLVLGFGIHVLVIDLFPSGSHDPSGMHGAVREMLDDGDAIQGDELPDDEPLSLVSYKAGQPIDAYLEQVRVGQPLPDMPLLN